MTCVKCGHTADEHSCPLPLVESDNRHECLIEGCDC